MEVNIWCQAPSTGNPIQIELNGPEHDVLRELAEEVVAEIAMIDGVFNPESGASEGVWPHSRTNHEPSPTAVYGPNRDQIS